MWIRGGDFKRAMKIKTVNQEYAFYHSQVVTVSLVQQVEMLNYELGSAIKIIKLGTPAQGRALSKNTPLGSTK